jgi:NADH-quinone oxidoreductase subunit M
MITIWIVAIPVIGGLLAWASGRWNSLAARWISAAALVCDFGLVVYAWVASAGRATLTGTGPWLYEADFSWISRFGIRFHLAMDGLSLVLVALTVFLGFLAVVASWTGITRRVGFFHFNLLFVLAGIAGVFLAADFFLFYFFWELMLVPMYFLIGIWGHERRLYASFKFFLFTQLSGLAMLVAILALYFVHAHQTGVYTFDYRALLSSPLRPVAGLWITLGFVLAFTVKIAAVPVHSWLPDAHSEAPTAGSVVLAGLLLKTGAYGLLRFVLPLSVFVPGPFASVMMGLGVASIIYGAKLAFAQTDVKRLVAYTSVSHMGFILLALFSLSRIAVQGAVLQMLCHGISTGALFVIAGMLQDRLGTRDMGRMGGLWTGLPRLGAAGMLFALASLGLPGLGNFVAEFLILLGSFQTYPVFTIVAAIGFIASTIYALALVQRVFHGEAREKWHVPDLNRRELFVLGLLTLAIVWLGVYPQPVLNTFSSAVGEIQKTAITAGPGMGAGMEPGPRVAPKANTTSGTETGIVLPSGIEERTPALASGLDSRTDRRSGPTPKGGRR